ncbi:unnamed protein product, partial [Polarella glacialis]
MTGTPRSAESGKVLRILLLAIFASAVVLPSNAYGVQLFPEEAEGVELGQAPMLSEHDGKQSPLDAAREGNLAPNGASPKREAILRSLIAGLSTSLGAGI